MGLTAGRLRTQGKLAMAKALVERRLVEEPESPKLWCAYGDVTGEDRHYAEAWERSGGRYARAQRNLAWSAQHRKVSVCSSLLRSAFPPSRPERCWACGA